jgi:adenylate cyclase class IV
MPLEIEIKLKLPAHETVRQLLVALGASHHGAVRETNIFFDRPDGSLRAADSGLRVRLTSPLAPPPATGQPQNEKKDADEALLTYKGPAAPTGLRSREAFDLHVRPGEQLVPLLRSLGFQQQLLFEKDRDSWRLDGCLVELDTLPLLGCFLEIEGPSEEAVRAVQAKLGLSGVLAERDSYSKMVGEYLRAYGSRELWF